MLPLSCFRKEMLAGSSLKTTAERVYSALHNPVTDEDRYEAARQSSKRFWDIALLGGPKLMRHGGRALTALDRDQALKQLLPGLALSTAAVALLPITGVLSGIYSCANPKKVASPEAAFVYRLRSAMVAHRRDMDRHNGLTDAERDIETRLNRYASRKISRDPCYKVKTSNSIDLEIGAWERLINWMPRAT